jgi:hypothetical protein
MSLDKPFLVGFKCGLLTDAIYANDIDMIMYLFASGIVCYTIHLTIAIRQGNLCITRLIIEHGYRLTEEDLLRVLNSNQLDIIEYLLSLRVVVFTRMISVAIIYIGSVDLMKLFYDYGLPIDDTTLLCAQCYQKYDMIAFIEDIMNPMKSSQKMR